MGATTLLSLAGTIEHGDFESPRRIGCFSYGSGCCSEFFSGTASFSGQQLLRDQRIGEQLDRRYELSMDEYESVLEHSRTVRFGTRNVSVDNGFLPDARMSQGNDRLVLTGIKEFHREYEWT